MFYDAAARHADTPATPAKPATQPTAGSLASAFVAALWCTLQRDHFDVAVAKCVQRKMFNHKEQRFTGAESHVATLFPRLVCALREVFVTEDAARSLPYLLWMTPPASVQGVAPNRLLYSTLELLVEDPNSPAADWMDSSSTASLLDGKRVPLEFARSLLHCDDPLQGTSGLLAVCVVADDAISDFNAALVALHARRSTLNESDVKTLFIKALDQAFYQPLVSRPLTHDQRDDTDLLTMQQWVHECFSAHMRAQAFAKPAISSFAATCDHKHFSDLRPFAPRRRRPLIGLTGYGQIKPIEHWVGRMS
ncbi:hypothetical protein CYMTET_33400 [Cymbomonas tetramitiformis]|uniref:Uncharacterized protein n=1 Tax=Cymbomonas tetramitiformis TaxID=36881 RepID=A0AAE0FD70_9CHLO|nr:hypothetical protein CYMTET_33400 [Cymbomonas tetramitiformis]